MRPAQVQLLKSLGISLDFLALDARFHLALAEASGKEGIHDLDDIRQGSFQFLDPHLQTAQPIRVVPVPGHHRRVAGAMELEEQRRFEREIETGVAVDGLDLHLVEKLDPRDRDARLDRVDRRLAGRDDAPRPVPPG